MMFQTEERGSYRYVKVQEQRLDVLSTYKLNKKLFFMIHNHVNKNIVFDISNCLFCDASGLGAIVKVHCLCAKEGGMLIVTGVQANIKKLIEICMLHSVCIITNDINDAETLLERGA